ncbi:hypothetical protein CB1_000743146 [Camelus ferus]|nr:hypothetical protein CB1_000743146 [Camelus ferus]
MRDPYPVQLIPTTMAAAAAATPGLGPLQLQGTGSHSGNGFSFYLIQSNIKVDVDEKMKFIFLSVFCQSLKEVNNYDRPQMNVSYFPEHFAALVCGLLPYFCLHENSTIVKRALKISFGKKVYIVSVTSPWNEKENQQIRPVLDYPIDNLTACVRAAKGGPRRQKEVEI